MKKIFKISIFLGFIYLLTKSFYLYSLQPAINNNSISKNLNYYFKFDYIKDSNGFKLDENNVTYIDYSKIKSLGVKNTLSYNPVSIGLSGLRFFQKNKKKLFLSQANWLVKNIQKDGAWYVMHDKKIGIYKLNAPWKSALSQGLGISVLVRAYAITKKEKYIVTARKALKPFTKYIKDGGIVSKNDFGDFYEEYPLVESPTHVLNGFIYSLFGLYDLYKYDNNQEAKKLFDKGIQTLKKILPLYDLKNWTRYDLNPIRNFKNHWGYSSPWYQKLHVVQLDSLYQITKDTFFLKKSNEFSQQAKYSYVNLIIYPSYILYTDFIYIYRNLYSGSSK